MCCYYEYITLTDRWYEVLGSGLGKVISRHARAGWEVEVFFVYNQWCGELEKAYREFERMGGRNEVEDLMLSRSSGNKLRLEDNADR